MELAEKRGELVNAKDVEKRLRNVFALCRQRLMAIPSKARQRDATFTPQHLVLLEGLIRDALEGLADPKKNADG